MSKAFNRSFSFTTLTIVVLVMALFALFTKAEAVTWFI